MRRCQERGFEASTRTQHGPGGANAPRPQPGQEMEKGTTQTRPPISRQLRVIDSVRYDTEIGVQQVPLGGPA
jgi:hypothetical protein